MKPEDVIIDPTLSREEFIGQAVGAASVCWTDMAGQGIFESERATQLVKEIICYMDQELVDHRYKIAKEISSLGNNRNPNDPIGSALFSKHCEHIADRIRNPQSYSGMSAKSNT